MTSTPTIGSRPLPRGAVLFISSLIGCHLLAVVCLVLAAPSGPWPTSVGTSMALEPEFAQQINQYTQRYYLQPLHLANNYHFQSNRMGFSLAYFKVVLRDKAGNVIKTIKFPEENVNFWVRHRQNIIAQGLAADDPVQARPGETIAAPGHEARTVTIWDAPKNETTLKLRTVPEHLLPRERPVFRPTEWSLLLAQSYLRYLSRHYQAASVELIRHSREPILPALMFLPEAPPGSFDELVCSYGEYRREK